MDRRLATKTGAAIYARRKVIVDPVFGQMKSARGLRNCLMRGLAKVCVEWALGQGGEGDGGGAPVAAAVVNSFRDGGYLEYALEQPAFLDGRIFAWPAEFFSQLQSAEADRGRYQAWMRELGAEWAIATRRVERLGGFRLFHASPDWALVYWDGLNEVFLRRDVPRFAPIIAKAEYRYFRPYGSILGNVVSTAPGRAARVRRRGGAVRTHLPGRSVRRAGALRARPADGRGRGRVRPGPAARHHAAAARAGTAGRLGASRGRAVGLSRAAPAVRAAPPSARWA